MKELKSRLVRDLYMLKGHEYCLNHKTLTFKFKKGSISCGILLKYDCCQSLAHTYYLITAFSGDC